MGSVGQKEDMEMRRIFCLFLGVAIVSGAGTMLAENHEIVKPAKISKSDTGGEIFKRKNMREKTHDSGYKTLNVTTLVSSDKKFSSGMYKSEKMREEYKDAYGVDEFMFFLEGGVTLTSSDGTVQVINAGEGVTIPKEWTGVWDTDGYSKIWVIYSEDD